MWCATAFPIPKPLTPIGTGREYTEGDIMPPEDTGLTEMEAKAKAYDILAGEAD